MDSLYVPLFLISKLVILIVAANSFFFILHLLRTMSYSTKTTKTAAEIDADKRAYGLWFENEIRQHLSGVGFCGQAGVPCMYTNGKQATEIDVLVQNAEDFSSVIVEVKSSLHPDKWAGYLNQSERQISFYPGAPLVVCTRASTRWQQQNLAGYKQYVATYGSTALLKVIFFATTVAEFLAIVHPQIPMDIVMTPDEPEPMTIDGLEANIVQELIAMFSQMEIDDDVSPMSL